MCLQQKKKGRVSLKFCLAGFLYLFQELRSNCLLLSNEYATIVMRSVRFLNYVKKSATHNF